MKNILVEKFVQIPEDVKVSVKARRVTVTGPRGQLHRDFRHTRVDMRLRGSSVRVAYYHGGKKLSAMVNTIASHVENMITGVTKGFRYNMRLVYAHFPIDTTITTKEGRMHLDIRNFLGGKKSQHITMGEGVEITKSEFVKDELILEGNSIEEVSQSAASIQQSLSIKGKDLRKFLDGIYVSQKGFVVE